MLSFIGLAAGLALLIALTMRGTHILIAATISALLVAVTSGLPLLPPFAETQGADYVSAYMRGFTGFLFDWLFMFLLGAIFGEVMAASGAADSAARWVIDRLGVKYAVLAVVAACAVLTYGGVSVFIVAFSVYPMAVGLFREANLPHRFIPAALAFGSVTFTMTSAGSPEIQNLIPMAYLDTTALAGWQVSLPVAVVLAVMGYVWLQRMVGRATARGEVFDGARGQHVERDLTDLPHPALALIPLVAVVLIFNLTDGFLEKYALIAALAAGTLIALAIGWRHRTRMPQAFTIGAAGAVVAITNTCAVVGFGTVAQLTPAFQETLELVRAIPGDPLIGAAIAITVICGLTGSASGGQTIALPLIAPGYVAEGVDQAELHRVAALASGALDSLPHNGYVVTTIRAICGETHARAYGPVGALTVVLPAAGLVMALALFIVF
jgi:H+/gluconate symporter-like permease